MRPMLFPQIIGQLNAEAGGADPVAAGLARASLEALQGDAGARFTLRRALALAEGSPLDGAALRKRVTAAVMCRDEESASALLTACGAGDIRAACRIGGEDTEYQPADIMWCSVREPGLVAFEISRSSYVSPHLPFLMARWLAVLPAFAAFGRQQRAAPDAGQTGEVALNLGGQAGTPGLAFNASGGEFALIPDREFTDSRGFERVRQGGPPVAWGTRRRVMVWRGTGPAQQTLSALAATHDSGRAEAWFDVAPAAGGRRDIEAWGTGRAALDTGGITGSSGIFLTLLSGAAVLMKATADGSRMWLHERMHPWVHYVPVAADLSDLVERVSWVRSNDDAAEEIGRNGRMLALAADYDGEMSAAGLRIAASLR